YIVNFWQEEIFTLVTCIGKRSAHKCRKYRRFIFSHQETANVTHVPVIVVADLIVFVKAHVRVLVGVGGVYRFCIIEVVISAQQVIYFAVMFAFVGSAIYTGRKRGLICNFIIHTRNK